MVRFHLSSEQGGALVITAGLSSTTKVQRSFPGATVNVYTTGGAAGTVTTVGTTVTRVTGTPFNPNGQWNGLAIVINSVSYTVSSVASEDVLTLTSSAGTQASPVAYSISVAPAAIYADNSLTPKANPFTTDSTGAGFFYAENSTVDLRFSGAGIASPFTVAAVSEIDPVLPGAQGDLLYKGEDGTFAAGGLNWSGSTLAVSTTGVVNLVQAGSNASLALRLIPSGTSTTSYVLARNSSDPSNYARLLTGVDGAKALIETLAAGTPSTPITEFDIGEISGNALLTMNFLFNNVVKASLSKGGILTAAGVVTGALTVATLPSSPAAGQRAFVTDSNAASFTAGIGAVAAGGGSVGVPVVWDGAAWRIG